MLHQAMLQSMFYNLQKYWCIDRAVCTTERFSRFPLYIQDSDRPPSSEGGDRRPGRRGALSVAGGSHLISDSDLPAATNKGSGAPPRRRRFRIRIGTDVRAGGVQGREGHGPGRAGELHTARYADTEQTAFSCCLVTC